MARSSFNSYDAIIIGGGPSGATAANILAQKGHRVVVLEKERFPRYHVGESLMPFCFFTLERIGVLEEVKNSSFPHKFSVQFARQNGSISQPFYFFEHFDHEASTTWQVLRSRFDSILLDKARSRGAEVREQVAVRRLLKDGTRVIGVEAKTANGNKEQIHAAVTIDASGRNCLAASKEGWRVRDPSLNKVSIWTYYEGARRDPGLDAGATTVAYLPEKGWFWYIPMAENRVSVGIVAERKYLFSKTRDPAEVFSREIQNNLWIRDHLAIGKQAGRYWVTGEYSYRSRYCACDGLVLTGDAFAFLDPVFSSGVYLALKSGALAADAVDAALTTGDCSGNRFSAYGQTICEGIENMRKLVYAFYDTNFSFGELARRHPKLRGELTDCLIGDLLSRDYSELFSAIGELVEIPGPVDYGFRPFPA